MFWSTGQSTLNWHHLYHLCDYNQHTTVVIITITIIVSTLSPSLVVFILSIKISSTRWLTMAVGRWSPPLSQNGKPHIFLVFRLFAIMIMMSNYDSNWSLSWPHPKDLLSASTDTETETVFGPRPSDVRRHGSQHIQVRELSPDIWNERHVSYKGSLTWRRRRLWQASRIWAPESSGPTQFLPEF